MTISHSILKYYGRGKYLKPMKYGRLSLSSTIRIEAEKLSQIHEISGTCKTFQIFLSLQSNIIIITKFQFKNLDST